MAFLASIVGTIESRRRSFPTGRHASSALTAGDEFELSVQQFSNVPRSSLLGRRASDDVTATIRVTVATVLDPALPANDFALTPNPAPPVNVFVPLGFLQARLQQPRRVNALLAFGATAAQLNEALAGTFAPEDVGLRISVARTRRAYVSVEAEQLVLEPAAVAAVEAAARDLGYRSARTSVYLANWIETGGSGDIRDTAVPDVKRIPYSVVAGSGPEGRASARAVPSAGCD